MKWNSNDIIQFLNIFEQYPILWNKKHDKYCNGRLKETVFKTMFERLKTEGLVTGMDEKQLRVKIKTVKDVYRQELAKIEKSKHNKYGIEGIYTPKLAWFNNASFFRDILSTRHSQPHSEGSTVSEPREPDAVGEWEIQGLTEEPQTESPKSLGTKRHLTSLSQPNKRQLIDIDASQHLEVITEHSSEEKPYDQFGKYVASELRQLPQLQAILLQQEIQNSIIQVKLSCLQNSTYPSYTESTEDGDSSTV